MYLKAVAIIVTAMIFARREVGGEPLGGSTVLQMNPLERQTFTRSELQGLKAEMEQHQQEEDIKRMVNQIQREIIYTARDGKQTLFKDMSLLPEYTEDRGYTLIMTVIDELHRIFPGVDIKYDVQTCIRTGKKMNQGIYVDWS
jgi:hypothetical protein